MKSTYLTKIINVALVVLTIGTVTGFVKAVEIQQNDSMKLDSSESQMIVPDVIEHSNLPTVDVVILHPNMQPETGSQQTSNTFGDKNDQQIAAAVVQPTLDEKMLK